MICDIKKFIKLLKKLISQNKYNFKDELEEKIDKLAGDKLI